MRRYGGVNNDMLTCGMALRSIAIRCEGGYIDFASVLSWTLSWTTSIRKLDLRINNVLYVALIAVFNTIHVMLARVYITYKLQLHTQTSLSDTITDNTMLLVPLETRTVTRISGSLSSKTHTCYSGESHAYEKYILLTVSNLYSFYSQGYIPHTL